MQPCATKAHAFHYGKLLKEAPTSESPVYTCPCKIFGQTVDPNTLSDGVKWIAQPLSFCLFSCVHDTAGHLDSVNNPNERL
eukprot:980010-Pelagomonas_calceolata.AAC.2